MKRTVRQVAWCSLWLWLVLTVAVAGLAYLTFWLVLLVLVPGGRSYGVGFPAQQSRDGVIDRLQQVVLVL